MVLVSFALVLAASAHGPSRAVEFDRLAGRPAAPIAAAAPATEDPATRLGGAQAGQRVLWDLTHGVYLGYEPAYYYSQATQLLKAAGFSVETTTAGLATLELSSWDVLVVAIGSCWLGAYTPAEVGAIQAFVAGGGGLLVMGDNPNVWPENIEPVAQAFGTATALTKPLPDDLVFGSLAPHPIFEGVGRLNYKSAGQLAGTSPSIEVAFALSGETLVCVTPGSRVVITGDVNPFDNFTLQEAGNVRFLHNVFAYLATGGAPLPSSLPAGSNARTAASGHEPADPLLALRARVAVDRGLQAQAALIRLLLLL